MLKLNGRLPALIVDPDPVFLKEIQTDPASTLAPPLVAMGGREAQAILSDPHHRFLGIFVNPKIESPGGIPIIRSAHQFHVGTPLFVLYDENLPFDQSELENLAIQKAVRKPLSYSEILALVAPIVPSFDASAALAAVAKNADALDLELDRNGGDFSPIRIENFLAGHKSFFDIYVRLKGGRFVKILQGGDAFSEDRITNYLKKGVKEFFIRKEAQGSYVAYCDHLSSALIGHASAPVELKVSQTLNAGEEVLKFLTRRGVSNDNLKNASHFVGNIKRIVDELKLAERPEFEEFLNDAAAYDHAVCATMIAGLLMPKLEMTLPRIQNSVGIATLLHDIGLYKLAPHLEDKDQAAMSPEELRLYVLHPKEGATILGAVGDIDPLTLYAVQHHHERRDGRGFPKRPNAGAPNLIGEVVGISDEFARLLRLAKVNPRLNPLALMRTQVYDGFSFRVMQAFVEIFGQ